MLIPKLDKSLACYQFCWQLKWQLYICLKNIWRILAELEGRSLVSCKNTFCYCLFISNQIISNCIIICMHILISCVNMKREDTKRITCLLKLLLIALLVQSKISVQDLRFLKRCVWRCWSSGMSRPVARRQWPACCRHAVPSFISSSCLRVGALSQRVRNRLHSDIASYPRRTERFRLEVLLWPVPHVHTSTSLVRYFGPTHFIKIILILSCCLPSCLTNLLPLLLSKTRICFGCQKVLFIQRLFSSPDHVYEYVFTLSTDSDYYPWQHTNAKFPYPGWTSDVLRMRAVWPCHSASCLCSNV
jgi:hypothetical protein